MKSSEFSPEAALEPSSEREAYRARVWRIIPADSHPLNFHYLLHSAGRFARGGGFGCLYVALSPGGAEAEHKKQRRNSNLQVGQAVDLWSMILSVNRVLHLEDDAVREELGISLDTITGDGDDDRERCRKIAAWAEGAGWRALLYPSAADPDAENLAIFTTTPATDLTFNPHSLQRQPFNYAAPGRSLTDL